MYKQYFDMIFHLHIAEVYTSTNLQNGTESVKPPGYQQCLVWFDLFQRESVETKSANSVIFIRCEAYIYYFHSSIPNPETD